MKIYIAGPMTGLPENNFPAFTRAAAILRAQGHEVVNPAELDAGEVLTHPWDYYLRRDLKKLVDCEAIAMLDGWKDSRGAQLEFHVANALGMVIRYFRYFPEVDNFYLCAAEKPPLATPPKPITHTILEEAGELVNGDRWNAYGHPADDMARTGRIWAAVLGIPEVTAAQVALCMVGVKMSREVNKPKRDNRVDGAGYFQCLDMIREREGK